MKRSSAILLVAVALAGCSARPAPATPVPTQVAPPAPAATLIPAASPTAVATATPSPTVEAALIADRGGDVDATESPTGTASADSNRAAQTPTLPAPTATAEATVSPTATVAATPAAAGTTGAVDVSQTATPAPGTPAAFVPSTEPNPLQIEVMRSQSYPGSAIVVEQKLEPGANYTRSIVSYQSEGNKIYALMTVPAGEKPATGWPVIIFNHGFIPPAQYRTTERYVAYVDAIARAGYIVFKSDYRGHGSSEGSPVGGYGSPGYTADVLNAVASMKAYADADPNRIGMWGHSLGGQLTLRAMVVSKDIKAGVIWGGVVAPYPDIFARGNLNTRSGQRTPTPGPTPRPGELGPYGLRGWRQELQNKYGTPEQNPAFWASISPNSFLKELSGPLELHHSTTDEEVPVAASKTLARELEADGLAAELFTYPGDNHNINGNFATAMQRTIAFFDKYVKGS